MDVNKSDKMNRKIIISILLFFILFIKPTFAHCPLCVAATGTAVATARFYGVDDLIVGTFVGGFIISTAFWFNKLLRKRNKRKNYLPFQLTIIVILSFVLTFVSFQSADIVSYATFFGIDRILMGIIFGSIVTLVAFGFNDFMRKKNGNKNYVPFQVIFITIGFLLLSVLSYYIMGLL